MYKKSTFFKFVFILFSLHYEWEKKGVYLKQKDNKVGYKVRLAINIDVNLKNEFLTLAKENETDANKLVRSFIKKYVQKHRNIGVKKWLKKQ